MTIRKDNTKKGISIIKLRKEFDKLSEQDKTGVLGKQIQDKIDQSIQSKAKSKKGNTTNEFGTTEKIEGATQQAKIEDEETVKEIHDHSDESLSVSNKGNKNEDYVSKPFSSNKPIYLQIHRQNIYQYFISGLISPTIYEINRPQSDIQSIFKGFLQLSNGILDELKNDDALIELALNELDKNELKEFSSIALISKPLPISRIRKIYVNSNSTKTDLLTTAQSTDAGIIPEFLVNDSFPDNVELIIQDEEVLNSERQNEYSKEISEFDRILGAYAFGRNAQLLYSNKTNIYTNYSEQYLGFVKLLLPELNFPDDHNNKQLNFYKQLLGLRNQDESPILKWLFERAKTGVNFTSNDISEFDNILLKSHKDKSFREQGYLALKILNDGIKRKTAPNHIIKNVEHKDKIYLYIFSYLYLYGNRTAEDRTNSRLGVANDATLPYAEFIYTILGYFYGYSLLRNKDEKQKYLDPDFERYAPKLIRPSIKFELQTLFDFYLIEAIYQYTFNSSVSNTSFDYIGPLDLENEKVINQAGIPLEYEFHEFEILGRQFFKLFKKSASDELNKMLALLPEEVPVVSDIGLYCIRSGIKFKWNLNALLYAFSDIKKLRSLATISKLDIVDHINVGKANAKDMLDSINATIRYKESE